MKPYFQTSAKILILITLTSAANISWAELSYRFHWGKIPVAEFSLDLPNTESQILKLEGRTVGFVGALFHYDGIIQSDYSDMSSVVLEISGNDNGFEEYRRIKFFVDRPAEIIDFLDDEQEQPSTEIVESMGITVDPFRVALALVQIQDELGFEVPLEGRCQGEFSVFDGKRHYQLKLQGGETEVLKADRSWGYSGQAMRCDMAVSYLEATSGEEQNPWYENKTDTRSVWIAKMEIEGEGEGEQELVPVRISMPGPIGRVTGRLEILQ